MEIERRGAAQGSKFCARAKRVFKARFDNVAHKHEMEERPKGRLSLKLGQRKLSFQQKPLTSSKTHEEPATQQAEPSSSTGTKDEGDTTREIPPLSGLCNLGNTCYVNSLLQPLRFCPQFSQWIEELHKLSEQVGAKEHGVKEADKTRPRGQDTTTRLSLNNGVAKDDAMDCSEPCAEEKEKPLIGLATHLHMVMVVTIFLSLQQAFATKILKQTLLFF